MRVVWVRHSPKVIGRANRDNHLLSRLATKHDIHVVTWEDADTISNALWKRFQFKYSICDSLPTYTIPKLPRVPGWRLWWRSINEPIFRAAIKYIEIKIKPDIVVVAPCWQAIGFPHLTKAIRVFDWLDGTDWRYPNWRASDIAYLDWSQAVMTVSEALALRAAPWQRPTVVIPNGVELARLISLQDQRDFIRQKLNVNGCHVVSLIGLTAAADHYWVETIRKLVKENTGIVFVAVGRGGLSQLMLQLATELSSGFRWIGPVDYETALEWFVASDVTWYPAEDNDYFHVASPLKIYEGLAAGAQVVVAPKLRSLKNLNIPSLHFADPTTSSLLATTLTALQTSRLDIGVIEKQLAQYSWDNLAEQMSTFFDQLPNTL